MIDLNWIIIGSIIIALLIIVHTIVSHVFKPKKIDWQIQSLEALEKLKKSHLPDPTLLVELDKLIESILQQRFGYKNSLESILKAYAKVLDHTTLNDIWQAHKLRDQLEQVDKPRPEDIKKAVQDLKKYCQNLCS